MYLSKIITFRHRMPVARTMAFEKLYHPNLAFSYRGKCEILKQQAIKVWMFVDERLAGEVYGMRLGNSDEQIEGTEKFHPDTLYTYSISILKPFQGLGLSKILKAYFLGCARSGFKTVIGHSLQGASIQHNLSFGAKVIQEFPKWYGTSKTAYLYQIDL